MKHFFIRAQLVFVSVILLATFSLMMVIVSRYNKRWDLTREQIYSLSDATQRLVQSLGKGRLEVIAFYPQDDPSRHEFERFLKQVAQHHENFSYRFYDPDRVPRLSREYDVTELYTVVLDYDGNRQKIIRPTEQSFATALLRLVSPRTVNLCFVTGHGEGSVTGEHRDSYSLLRKSLEFNNYQIHEIILDRDGTPALCTVLVVAGPHRDLSNQEFTLLKEAFESGKGILFLVDPMDPGTGESFRQFLRHFGVFLGSDVIVDKMGRMVGGDFLTPVVNRYVSKHPITAGMEAPSFFPVARSVQPSADSPAGIEAVPIAFTGSSSWAETSLSALERGKAAFEAESDLSGPLAIAVAAEKETRPGASGRIVVVGDSGFVTNGFLDIGGNRHLAMSMIQWLAKDERQVTIQARNLEFTPLFMNLQQKWTVLGICLGAMPFSFLLIGGFALFVRRKTS